MVILQGDIYSYRVNKQEEYQMQVLQIFLTIKMPCLRRHTAAYTVLVAILTFKVIQGERFSCHLKANMRLPIGDQ